MWKTSNSQENKGIKKLEYIYTLKKNQKPK